MAAMSNTVRIERTKKHKGPGKRGRGSKKEDLYQRTKSRGPLHKQPQAFFKK
jgi:hypothetical protein